jgi:hypothetical protein
MSKSSISKYNQQCAACNVISTSVNNRFLYSPENSGMEYILPFKIQNIDYFNIYQHLCIVADKVIHIINCALHSKY